MTAYDFTLVDEEGYLHTRYFGDLSVSDIEEALVAGNALYPGVDSLVDLSAASLKGLSMQDIQRLVALAVHHEPRGINCAFVAPDNLEFGLSRMYSTFADAGLPQNRAVFRSLSEARAWLVDQGRRGQGSRRRSADRDGGF